MRLSLDPRSQAFFIASHDTKDVQVVTRITQVGGTPGIRASRLALWSALLEALPVGDDLQIEFSASVVNIQQHDGKQVSVLLEDGRLLQADLVIAADGNRSRVRSVLLPDEKLHFTGCNLIGGTARMDRLPALIEKQHGLIMGNGASLFAAPETENTAIW